MIYALATDGPLSQPNSKRYVSVIDQSELPNFYVCHDLKTGDKLTVHKHNLELVWIAEKQPA